jgi:glycosyltransferase involved in cell wall biosynthesis
MKLSIIIPTYNAGTYIRELLERIQSQTVQPFEIIIIDSSSKDNTVQIAEELGARTSVIPKHIFNHGGTRNKAAGEAAGDILVFMTQDALPFDNHLLNYLSESLKHPDVATAFARHIPSTDASLLEIFARKFNYPEQSSIKGISDIKQYGIKTFFSSDVCSAIKKEAFLKAGMFPEGIRANEDMLLSAQLILNGYKIAYVPDAKIIHSHHYSLLKQFCRYYNIGSSLRRNDWILKYAKAESEGVRFVKEQILFVVKQRKYILIPYIFLEAIMKYIGFRLGLIVG